MKNQLDAIKSYLSTHALSDHISFRELFDELNGIVKQKKIVIFIDEFDGIPRDELEHFLTTLRELYQEYKESKDKALYSVGLVGIRNITKLIVGGVSPFNEEQSLLLTHGLIKAEGKDLRVGNPLYKKRFTKTFFREAASQADVSSMRY